MGIMGIFLITGNAGSMSQPYWDGVEGEGMVVALWLWFEGLDCRTCPKP